MKVRRIKAKSIRGIKDLTLEFNSNAPTILIGINGSGKSSVLGCIAAPLSHLVSLALLASYKKLDHRLKITNPFTLVWRERDIRNGSNYAYNEITISHESSEITWALEITTSESGKLKSDCQFSELDAFVEKEYSRNSNSSQHNLPLLACYPTNRGVLKIPLEIKDDSLTEDTGQIISDQIVDSQTFLSIQVDFESFFRWFRVLEDIENEERRDRAEYRDKRLQAARDAIYSIQPDLSELRVRRSPLRMTVQKNGEELIINQLSDGEKCLLAMVGDLARRLAVANPNLSNPLQGEGIVLIDEIELHLHPQWQRGIISKLTKTFPNCQFIVTTHSPQVIGDVHAENIYLLESTPDGITARHPEHTFGRDSNWILEVVMDSSDRDESIKNQIYELFRLIDAGQIEEARSLRKELGNLLGENEPQIAKADVLIRRREILGR